MGAQHCESPYASRHRRLSARAPSVSSVTLSITAVTAVTAVTLRIPYMALRLACVLIRNTCFFHPYFNTWNTYSPCRTVSCLRAPCSPPRVRRAASRDASLIFQLRDKHRTWHAIAKWIWTGVKRSKIRKVNIMTHDVKTSTSTRGTGQTQTD